MAHARGELNQVRPPAAAFIVITAINLAPLITARANAVSGTVENRKPTGTMPPRMRDKLSRARQRGLAPARPLSRRTAGRQEFQTTSTLSPASRVQAASI